MSKVGVARAEGGLVVEVEEGLVEGVEEGLVEGGIRLRWTLLLAPVRVHRAHTDPPLLQKSSLQLTRKKMKLLQKTW